MKKISKRLFSIVGVLCIVIAVFMMISSANASKRCTQAVTATLLEYRIDHNSNDNSTAYFPVVQYVAGHKHIEAVASSGSGNRPYELGAEVKIKYNPDDPYEFIFEGDKSSRNWGIYMLILGVGMIAIDMFSAHGIEKSIISRGEGFGEEDYDDYSYHSHRTHHRGQGVSIDIGSIVDAAKFAKKFKETTSELKKLSPDERKALYEALDENPEIFLKQEGEEEKD